MEAADLVRESVTEDMRRYTVYGQRGFGEFLRLGLIHPGVLNGSESWVAIDDTGKVGGFARFDVSGVQDAHLGIVCTAPELRRRGIATEMIGTFRDAHPEVTSISLHVFEGNAGAIAMYQRMGFVRVSEVAWLTRGMPPASGVLTTRDLEHSLASHALFGFSQVKVAVEGSAGRIGRLGDDLIRLSRATDMADEALLAAVAAAFPTARTASLIADNEGEARLGGLCSVTKRAAVMKLDVAGRRRPA
jgi:GNAT superfamily N-acetyltransferase